MATFPQLKQIKHISPEPHYPNKMVIHTTDTHGLYYLFIVIDGAIWLLSKDRSISEVDIILHPVFLKAEVRRLLKNARKFFAAKFSRVKTETTSQNRDEVSLERRIYEFRERVTLETSLGRISVYISPKPFVGNILCWFRSFWQAIQSWKQCHINGYLVFQNLLSLRYREVLIGDLIASTVLRSNSKCGGSLSACSKIYLFSVLLNGIFISDYIWHEISEDLANHCVIVSEHTYLHSIYKRVLHHRGAKVLDYHYYATDFKLIEPNEPLQNPQIAQKKDIQLSAFDRARAITYLHERIYAPHKHLWYMTQGYNRTDNQLLNTEDKRIEILPDKLYAVVFLHSFYDAQYFYGVDDFDDIYHWTIFTIDNLLANPNIEKVFVKQHPNVDYESYPGDKIAYERLVHRYANQLKLDWLRKDCSPLSLSTSGCFVGITHHGSIAEELTFLGIPVIASTFAPWGKAYAFVHTWENLDNYKSLLQSLALETWTKPSEAMLEELYKYVVEYRLNAFPVNKKFAWMKFAEFLNCEINSLEFLRLEYELACDDPRLINFLNYLVLEKQRK
ncbi:MAG: hypothetical protein NZ660_12255 [Oscillatoriaceae bacterium SKYG93]|nr:hypothetical protein [Oscillatoriaceae bacterium SKYG93]MDW8454215.1 hypothetical protein [Oscillatoriaceae cyanobacterium SKYGB_i_bin93]